MLPVSRSCFVVRWNSHSRVWMFHPAHVLHLMPCFVHLRWFARPTYAPRDLPRQVTQVHVSTSAMKVFLRSRCGSHNLPNDVGRRQGVPRFQRFCLKCHAQGDLAVVTSIILCLNVPLFSLLETDIRTCFLGLLRQCRNSCGKWTCARLSCVSEIAYLCCWMFQLLVLLTMTVMMELISFDASHVPGVASYLHLFTL